MPKFTKSDAVKGRGNDGMDDNQLTAVLRQEIQTSIGWMSGQIVGQRRRALEQYYAKPYGNEQAGRSQVISMDVQDVIESMLPDFVEVFASGEDAVAFDPENDEDVDGSKEATAYVNYIFHNDNNGFEILHDWFKDALLQKNGIVKTVWDDTPKKTRHVYSGLNELELQELRNDPEVEIIEFDERNRAVEPIRRTFSDGTESQDSDSAAGEMQRRQDAVERTEQADADVLEAAGALDPATTVYDVTIIRTRHEGRICTVCIPPEEFLISRRAINIDDASFLCHKVKKRATDLREMGYTQEVIDSIPSHDEQYANEERVVRFQTDEEYPDQDDTLDPAMREIWLYECYIKVDYDGDGIAERRNVTVAGPALKILENKIVAEQPFDSITPIKMPHKFFGRAVTELVEDIQLIKTTLQRQLLDNVYFANNARTAISKRVNLDDYLSQRPGQAVRVDADTVGGHIEPLVTAPILDKILPTIEYFDGVRELRTGQTRYNQGMDADSLNKTLGGIDRIMGMAQKRKMLIARRFAEMGIKPLFKRILRLVHAHQDKPRMIRLNNRSVRMDPKVWNVDMDMKVKVGLGHATKEQQLGIISMLAQAQEKLIQLQGGAQGPFVTPENIYNLTDKLVHAAGFQDTGSYFTDPTQQPPQPPKPDPASQALQMQAQLEQQKTQAQIERDNAKVQAQIAKDQADMEMDREKAAQDARQAEVETQANMTLARWKAEQEIEIKRVESQERIALERERMAAQIEIERAKAASQAMIASEKANESNQQVQ